MTRAEASGFERAIDDDVRARVSNVHIFDTVDSTNSFLLRQPPPAPGAASVALADDQTAGRGRHDRHWISRRGASLCLSVAYTFQQRPDTLLGLTQAMGVAVSRALKAQGLEGLELKWPNDLVINDSKLGGLLAETMLKGDRSVTVVAGVGINMKLPQELLEASVSAWAHRAIDLASVMRAPPSRDALAARTTSELLRVFAAFGSGQQLSLLREWREQDWLLGKDIVVDGHPESLSGQAAGVADDGALLVETRDGVRRVIAGSVRVESS